MRPVFADSDLIVNPVVPVPRGRTFWPPNGHRDRQSARARFRHGVPCRTGRCWVTAVAAPSTRRAFLPDRTASAEHPTPVTVFAAGDRVTPSRAPVARRPRLWEQRRALNLAAYREPLPETVTDSARVDIATEYPPTGSLNVYSMHAEIATPADRFPIAFPETFDPLLPPKIRRSVYRNACQLLSEPKPPTNPTLRLPLPVMRIPRTPPKTRKSEHEYLSIRNRYFPRTLISEHRPIVDRTTDCIQPADVNQTCR
ncbi:Hypothetical protein CINCED_3A009114 [Cinara cedri]|uniref:Uncharacterized protein n=1 Tax=Cinara cedri TaxID=506608 RepID=A0A5E4M0A4_9HEMI|nr:Hypothetical protein CINCED_3A009114 [Cinara cedri]